MKRLLLHVGYPKAASTSLQNGLFLGLHKKKVVNFLGRAFESHFQGEKQTWRDYKKWFVHVIEGGHYEKNSIGNLSENTTNVLSEGLFMMNERRTDDIVGPDLLHKYFSGQADSIKILLLIRKQADLMSSYFIQNYRKLGKKDFNHFLTDNLKRGWAGEGKIFNFYDVARAYATAFGKDNVHIVLFEDFARDKDRFSTELAKAINVDADVIKDHLGEGHLNQTRKEPGILVVKKLDPKSARHRLIKRLEKWRLNALADALQVRLPAMSDTEKRTIFEAFKDSNLRLAEEFSLDKNVMREYGYF